MKKKTQNKLIKDSYEKIFKTANSVTKAYNCEYIPLNTLKMLLDSSKLKTKTVTDEFTENYNHTILLLYACCETHCRQHGLSDRVPMVILRLFIDSLKEGLDKAK